MTIPSNTPNPPESPRTWPNEVADAVKAVSAACVPSCLKALDRLIGAAADIPIAKLEQVSQRIRSQTLSFDAVERSLATSVSQSIPQDAIDRATQVLLRKAYRQQTNRDAVASHMLTDLAHHSTAYVANEIDDDWLNVFERYAGDASSEKMQQLWGRVVAGEIRRPGTFSLRLLRFLSEFTQDDALAVSRLAQGVLGDIAPSSLHKPDTGNSLVDLVALESSGIIDRSAGFGYQVSITFDFDGFLYVQDSDVALIMHGTPGDTIKTQGLLITPLGLEAIALLVDRDIPAAARSVALAMRSDRVDLAYLASVDSENRATPIETLWQSGELPPPASLLLAPATPPPDTPVA